MYPKNVKPEYHYIYPRFYLKYVHFCVDMIFMNLTICY